MFGALLVGVATFFGLLGGTYLVTEKEREKSLKDFGKWLRENKNKNELAKDLFDPTEPPDGK